MKHIPEIKNFMKNVNEATYVYKDGLKYSESLKAKLIEKGLKTEGPSKYLHPTKKTKDNQNWSTYKITVSDSDMIERFDIISDTDTTTNKRFFTIIIYDKHKSQQHSHDVKKIIKKDTEAEVVAYITKQIKK